MHHKVLDTVLRLFYANISHSTEVFKLLLLFRSVAYWNASYPSKSISRHQYINPINSADVLIKENRSRTASTWVALVTTGIKLIKQYNAETVILFSAFCSCLKDTSWDPIPISVKEIQSIRCIGLGSSGPQQTRKNLFETFSHTTKKLFWWYCLGHVRFQELF